MLTSRLKLHLSFTINSAFYDFRLLFCCFNSSFASFNAAKELPFDLEDALLLWLNKVSATNEKRLRKARSPDASSAASSGRFRFRREQILARSPTLFPKLDDLQIDVANGKALLSLLLFYFPETLSHESECLFVNRPAITCRDVEEFQRSWEQFPSKPPRRL